MSQAEKVGETVVVQSFDSRFNNYLEIYNSDGKLIHDVSFQSIGLGEGGNLVSNFASNYGAQELSLIFSSTR